MSVPATATAKHPRERGVAHRSSESECCGAAKYHVSRRVGSWRMGERFAFALHLCDVVCMDVHSYLGAIDKPKE